MESNSELEDNSGAIEKMAGEQTGKAAAIIPDTIQTSLWASNKAAGAGKIAVQSDFYNPWDKTKQPAGKNVPESAPEPESGEDDYALPTIQSPAEIEQHTDTSGNYRGALRSSPIFLHEAEEFDI